MSNKRVLGQRGLKTVGKNGHDSEGLKNDKNRAGLCLVREKAMMRNPTGVGTPAQHTCSGTKDSLVGRGVCDIGAMKRGGVPRDPQGAGGTGRLCVWASPILADGATTPPPLPLPPGSRSHHRYVLPPPPDSRYTGYICTLVGRTFPGSGGIYFYLGHR